MHNLNLIKKKYKTKLRVRDCTKLACHLQKCQGCKSQEKNEDLLQIEVNQRHLTTNLKTRHDSDWIRLLYRTLLGQSVKLECNQHMRIINANFLVLMVVL